MPLHSGLVSFFVSFIFLPLSNFTFFNVSYLTHPSIFLCFQAISKTQYLTVALLPYLVFVHTFLFLDFFHHLYCLKLTFGRPACLEACLGLFFNFYFLQSMEEQTNYLTIWVLEAFCGNILLLTASSCDKLLCQ